MDNPRKSTDTEKPLPTIVNYNEKTVTKLDMVSFKKIIMKGSELTLCEWNRNFNYIVAAGFNGHLKVFRIGINANQNGAISVNMPLHGHYSTVTKARWNEAYQKLASCDITGNVHVWNLVNNTWLYNIISSRKASEVVGISWNVSGTKLAIAYADGFISVGKLEGERRLEKNIDHKLSTCEFSPVDGMLILGTIEGRVFVYDDEGNKQMEIQMNCLETVDLEQALARTGDEKEEIIEMEYYHMTYLCEAKLEEQKQMSLEKYKQGKDKLTGLSVFMNDPERDHLVELVDSDIVPEPIPSIPADRPRFMIVYARGMVQLMRSVTDPDPVVVRLHKINVTAAKWSTNGTFLAVCGIEYGQKNSIVYFITAYGNIVSVLPCQKKISGMCWDESGLKCAFSTEEDVHAFRLKPRYKWGGIEDTLVYVYQNDEAHLYSVMFYDLTTYRKNPKIIRNFENMGFHKDHCVIIYLREDMNFYCEMCNCIGTSLDYCATTVNPVFVCLNGVCAVVANKHRYLIWHFLLPRAEAFHIELNSPGKSAEYTLEEMQRGIEYGTTRFHGSKDEICAICIGDTFFLIAIKSGGIYRVRLSDGCIALKYTRVEPLVDTFKLNCDYTKLAVLQFKDFMYTLRVYDFDGDNLKETFNEERNVSEFIWDEQNSNLIAYKNSNDQIGVLGEKISKHQTFIAGLLFSFRNLAITTINLDLILTTPENPTKKAVHEFNTSAKQNVSLALNLKKFDEAMEIAEKNSHEVLWIMIANDALSNHRYDQAEYAYVKLDDYAGIQFIKKLRNIHSMELQNAEIQSYLEKVKNAHELFMLCDRKDLAVEMYRKYDEPLSLYELVKNDNDTEVKKEAIRLIAEDFYENQEWKLAAEKFDMCGDMRMKIECLIRGEHLSDLEICARKQLPADSEHLELIGDTFVKYGFCDQAVDCFLKNNRPDKALAACTELSQWNKAQLITSHLNNLKNPGNQFEKSAVDFKGASDEFTVNTLGGLMRAGNYLDAAKLAFDIANDRRDKSMPYEDLKKCYCLGALLVEDYKKSNRNYEKDKKHNDFLDDESGLSVEQIRILENTWKGTEAYHFMILALQHFFKGRTEDALQTSLLLAEYEEYLNPAKVHQMIALAAANRGMFQTCSRAMMKLESYEGFTNAEKEEMKDLSFRLFTKFPPVNPGTAKMNCTACGATMKLYDFQCPDCHYKFPICVASGLRILDTVFWSCSRCHHHAYLDKIADWKFCPLCHDTETFSK